MSRAQIKKPTACAACAAATALLFPCRHCHKAYCVACHQSEWCPKRRAKKAGAVAGRHQTRSPHKVFYV